MKRASLLFAVAATVLGDDKGYGKGKEGKEEEGKEGYGKVKGKGKGDKICTGAEKEVNVELGKGSHDSFKIKAQSKQKYCKDELKFELKTKENDGAEMKLDIHLKDEEDKEKFYVKQKVFQVIEFNDTNKNNVVEAAEIVQQLKIGAKETGIWSSITYTQAEGKEDIVVYKIEVSAGDWFKIVARYAGNPVEFIENSTAYSLDPNAVKIDYIITNFPYKSNSTKLAIDGRFKSKAKMYEKKKYKKPAGTGKPEQEIEQVDVRDDSEAANGAQFKWVTEVDADGESVDVVASPRIEVSDNDEERKKEKDEKNYKIVWVFNKTGEVNTFTWDPTLHGDEEVSSETSETSAASPSYDLGTSAASLGCLLGAAILSMFY